MITPIEMAISLILILIVGIVLGSIRRKMLDELDKNKVKRDIEKWANGLKEANEKMLEIHEGMEVVYKGVVK